MRGFEIGPNWRGVPSEQKKNMIEEADKRRRAAFAKQERVIATAVVGMEVEHETLPVQSSTKTTITEGGYFVKN